MDETWACEKSITLVDRGYRLKSLSFTEKPHLQVVEMRSGRMFTVAKVRGGSKA